MLADLVVRLFSLVHQHVLGIDVVNGDFQQFKPLSRYRVGLEPFRVGDDMLRVDRKPEIAEPLDGRAVLFGAAIGQGREGNGKPDHFVPGVQNAAQPERSPRVVERGLTIVDAFQGVGNDGEVTALPMFHGVAQVVGVKLMFDDTLAPLTRLAAVEVGHAVAIDVEERRDLRILELVERRDAMSIRRDFVDQVTLQ